MLLRSPPNGFIKGEVAKPGAIHSLQTVRVEDLVARSWWIKEERVCRKRRSGAFRDEWISEGAR